MQYTLFILLLGFYTVLARPSSTEIQYVTPVDYKMLNEALRLSQEIEREIHRRINYEPRLRLRRKINSLAIPIKRVGRIGGNIVMGRKK